MVTELHHSRVNYVRTVLYSRTEVNPNPVYFRFQNNPSGKILNTYVVSASVTNSSGPIKDLEEDLEVTLHHLMSNEVCGTLTALTKKYLRFETAVKVQ